MPERRRRVYARLLAGTVLAASACRQHDLPADPAAFQAQAIGQVLTQFAPAYEAYHRQQPRLAVHRFDSILATVPHPAPFTLFMRQGLLYDIATVLQKNGAEGARHLDAGLRILERDDRYRSYPGVYTDALCKRGRLAFDAGNYQQAFNYYFRAEQVAGASPDSGERALYGYNIGMVLYRQQRYPPAARYFSRAYRQLTALPDPTGSLAHRRQELLDNIALCYLSLRQYDSATRYLHAALDLAERHRDDFGPYQMRNIRGVVLGNLGRVYAATGRPDSAIAAFRQSLALNTKPGAWNETRDAALVCAALAEVYLQQGRHAEAAAALRALHARLPAAHDPAVTLDWLRLQDAYQQATAPRPGPDYYRAYIRLRDSIQQAGRASQADITEQLRARSQTLQIRLLRQDLRLRRVYSGIIAGVALLACAILGLIYYGYRRSRRNVRLLTVLNQRVRDQKGATEQALREKDRILHVVAHDLRSPVGLTAYLAELIMMDDEHGQHTELLQMIRQSSEGAIRLVNDLLQLKTGGAPSTHEPVDLRGLLDGLSGPLRHQAQQKDQHLDLHLPAGPVVVSGDAAMLSRLVLNLAGNAFKFSHPAGSVRIRLERQPAGCVLTVSDDGIGIPAALQPQIFDAFTEARQAGTANEASHGLGLAICKSIVAQHGGTIAVQSAPGAGAVFTVVLPAC